MDNGKANSNNNGSKKALVIAVSDYDNASDLKSIEFCKNDGQEMYNVLKDQGYDIPLNRKLIGYVDSQRLKNAIYDFFTDEDNRSDDTLVFYYSGHGVPDKWGATFLAPSNIDSDHPFITGFSFDDLTNSMLTCNSQSIVTILDSCFSGSLKISKSKSKGLDSKSGEEAATIIANNMIEEKSDKLKQGVGRCLLAASQGYEEAYDRQEKDHSVFTYYLLEGLKGHKNAVDDEGNVTYDTLGKFITREIGNLPPEKRPKQTPVRKGEVAGGEIVLATYPELRKTKESDYYVLYGKGEDYYFRGKYNEALQCYDSILKIQPNNEFALLRKGILLVKMNDDKKALESFDHVIKLNNNNLDAWYYKAQLTIKIGNYEKALKYLDQASNINPDDERVWDGYKKVKSLMRSSREKENQVINTSQDEKQNRDLYVIDQLNDKLDLSKETTHKEVPLKPSQPITTDPNKKEEKEKITYNERENSNQSQNTPNSSPTLTNEMKTTTSNKYNTVNYKKLQHNKHSIQPPNISKAPIGEVIPSSSPKIADERKTTLTTESDIDRLHQKEEILQPSKGIIKDKIPTKPSEDIDALTIKKEAEKYPKRETNRQGQSINLKIIIIPIIVISVIGIVFAWNYLGSISSNNKIIDNTPDKEQIPSSISTGILNIVEGASITGNQNYQPNDLTIKQGSILTINNLDSTIHTVSQGNPNNLNSSIIFDSGIIRSEESYELDTSNIPLGSFEYYCVFHPYMTGKLNIIK